MWEANESVNFQYFPGYFGDLLVWSEHRIYHSTHNGMGIDIACPTLLHICSSHKGIIMHELALLCQDNKTVADCPLNDDERIASVALGLGHHHIVLHVCSCPAWLLVVLISFLRYFRSVQFCNEQLLPVLWKAGNRKCTEGMLSSFAHRKPMAWRKYHLSLPGIHVGSSVINQAFL